MGFAHPKCNRIRVDRLTGIESDLTYLTYHTYLNLVNTNQYIIITFDYASASCQSRPKTPKHPLFLKENGGTAEEPLEGRTSVGSPNPPLVLKKTSNPWMGSHLALSGPSYEGEWLQDQLVGIILFKNMPTPVFRL